ncbi:MAG: DUF402 domain-containing protein [Pyrinomonadaceae bacterium]
MTNKTIIINALKFDGSVHRTWKASIIGRNGNLLVFRGRFEIEVTHPLLGTIEEGTISYEYFWLDKWYNVFRFHKPNGEFRNFYCNVNQPPKFENGVLSFVDLDYDIIVDENFDYSIVDETDFEENKIRFGYPQAVIVGSLNALEELKSLISKRKFPFSKDIQF